jgi:hypothetical protein
MGRIQEVPYISRLNLVPEVKMACRNRIACGSVTSTEGAHSVPVVGRRETCLKVLQGGEVPGVDIGMCVCVSDSDTLVRR